MRYLLVGNYGVGNVGDEILRAYFIDRFPDVEWRVCSACLKQGEIPRFPAGIRSFFSFTWLKTLRELRQADGLVFGGGTLFTDVESLHACFVWWVHAFICVLWKKPFFLAFQGIGPFRTTRGERLARWVVQRADHMSVRDAESYDRLKMWKKNTEVVQSFDPSISLLKAKNDVVRSKNVFILIPRISTDWNSQIGSRMLSQLKQSGLLFEVLSLHGADPREDTICRKISSELHAPIRSVASLQEAVEIMQRAHHVMTQRYHGAVAAMVAGTPFTALPLQEGDKLDSFAKQCGQRSVPFDSFSVEEMQDMDWDKKHRALRNAHEECVRLVERGEEELEKELHRKG